MFSPVKILILVITLVGVVLLQIFLSKRESRFPGLVLPIISFVFSFLYPLNLILAFQAPAVASSQGSVGVSVFQMILAWLAGNIPTIILLAIYFGCRSKQRRNKQIEKMNIQDLD